MDSFSEDKRFRCSHPGCTKHFKLKEHLTRHMRSHAPHLQLRCPICGRKYARSDVLKRHIESHPRLQNAVHRLEEPESCGSCRTRGLSCDSDTPCRACAQGGIVCVRAPTSDDGRSQEAGRSGRLEEPEPNTFSGTRVSQAADIAHKEQQALPRVPRDDEFADDGWVGGPQVIPAPFKGNYPHKQMQTPAPVSVPVAEGVGSEQMPPWLRSAGAPPGSGPCILEPISLPQLASLSFNSGETPAVGVPVYCPSFDSHVSDLRSSTTPTESRSAAATALTPAQPSLSSGQPDPPAESTPEGPIDPGAFIRQNPQTTDRLIRIFFAQIHAEWPILHEPTFSLRDTDERLIGAMLVVSSWLEGGTEHMKLASCVLKLLLAASQPGLKPPLHILQAKVLMVVYTFYCQSLDGMSETTCCMKGMLNTHCRHLGVFDAQRPLPQQSESHSAFGAWLLKEHYSRVALACIKIDAYYTLISDYPPTLRYQEIRLPVMKTSQLWSSKNEEQRRSLQWNEPAGRENTYFAAAVREAVASGNSVQPTQLTDADYHLAICALQSAVWEAACDESAAQHPFDPIEGDTSDRSPSMLCRAQLNNLRRNMERDCQLSERYFSATPASASFHGSNTDFVLAPSTLLLWHASMLKITSPVTLLLAMGDRGNNQGGAVDHTVTMTLKKWYSSKCSRTALYNAAQIARIADRELDCNATRFPQASSTVNYFRNCLLRPSLLISAVVACAWAAATRNVSCPGGCGGTSSSLDHRATIRSRMVSDFVDLFGAKIPDDASLAQWIETGSGTAIWGMGRTPICRCHLSELAIWFRSRMEPDEAALGTFERFLDMLIKVQ